MGNEGEIENSFVDLEWKAIHVDETKIAPCCEKAYYFEGHSSNNKEQLHLSLNHTKLAVTRENINLI